MNSLNGILRAPGDIRFVYDYKRSKFLECNRTSAEEICKTYKHNSIEKSDSESEKKIKILKYATDYFDSIQKTYWIASGTLLGEIFVHFVIPVFKHFIH